MSLMQGLDSDNIIREVRVDSSGDVCISSTSTPSGVQPTSTSELVTEFGNFSSVDTAGGDFIVYTPQGLNGQNIVALTSSVLNTGESKIEFSDIVKRAGRMEVAMSYLRGSQIFATASLYANNSTTGLPDTVPDSINITGISQSSADLGATYSGSAGTIVRIDLESALPNVPASNAVFIGDWINITGVADNRLNYMNLAIKYISPDRKIIMGGVSDEVTLTSLAIPTINPTLGSAKVNFYNNMGGARDGFGMRMTQSTATSNVMMTIRDGGDNQVSGVLLGDHRVTTASTAINYVAGSNWGSFELRPISRFRFDCEMDKNTIYGKAEQTNVSWTPYDTPRETVRPKNNNLKPRFRIYKPLSMSRPIVEIVSAVKATASSTATITTRTNHNLVTGQYVTLKGTRDTVNFAPISVPVPVTVLTPTTFTATWGTAVISTSYGGSVVIANGSKDIASQFIAPVVIQSYAIDANGWVSVVGSASWTGVLIGDYVDLHGCGNNTNGAPTEIEGSWQVAHISTTTMVLMPISDVTGTRKSPSTAINVVTTNCGGAVYIRPTLRIHDIRVESINNEIKINGQGTADTTKAIPTYALGGTISAVQSTAGAIGTGGVGAWFVRGGAHSTADVVSGALTTVGLTTGGVIDLLGNTGSMQFNVDVTAISGTLPRLVTRVQGTFDNANYYTIYDIGVITNATTKTNDSPVIPVEFRGVRYVRDLRGTTPSVTHSVNRVIRSLESSKRQRKLIDSTVSLLATTPSTEYLYVSGCTNAQIMCTALSGQTTPAVLKVQLCTGDPSVAGNWYDVPNAPTITTSATSPVVTTTFDISHSRFARIVPTTAGVGMTAYTYELVLTAWE